MNPLDAMASEFHQQIEVPAGPGEAAIIKRGNRKRRVRTGGNVALASTLVIGLGVAAVNLGRTDTSLTVAAGDAAIASDEARFSIDLDAAMSVLPPRPLDRLQAPTPQLPGWTVIDIGVPTSDQNWRNTAMPMSFFLNDGADKAHISVLLKTEILLESSNPDVVTLNRSGESVLAKRSDADHGQVMLTWTEMGPQSDLMTIQVMAWPGIVEDIASNVTFDKLGTTEPVLIDTGPNPQVVLSGTTDGKPWRIVDYGNVSDLAIELDGTSPQFPAGPTTNNGLAGDIVSVSNNGTQINLFHIAEGATAIIETKGVTIELPSFAVDGSLQRLVVAPIPRTVRADNIIVRGSDGSTVTIPLTIAPTNGWHRVRYVSG